MEKSGNSSNTWLGIRRDRQPVGCAATPQDRLRSWSLRCRSIEMRSWNVIAGFLDESCRGSGGSAVLRLPQHVSGLGQGPDFEHAGFARYQGEIAAQKQCPAGLGVAAWSVGNDEIGVLSEGSQAVENVVCVGEAHSFHIG